MNADGAPADPEHDPEEPVPGFAPDDLDDGRVLYSPKSRWGPGAKVQIGAESLYLLLLLATSVWYSLTLLADSVGTPELLGLVASEGLIALVGGAIGGALYALKWHYHVVAKGLWHADRLVWRVFAPLISGVVAMAIALFATSGLLVILDQETMSTPTSLLATSILVGYFSDNAIGSLARLAIRIFGEPSSHRPGSANPRG